jgi:hypothetical protein
MNQPAWEVADVIREHGEAFLEKYGGTMSDVQRKALRDLAACRTATLGGHIERCADCGHERIAYNSCRNRHCPKCQAMMRARWLEQEATYLLPVEYYHVVFTLPQAVADLAVANARLVYNLLFQAMAATLREVAADPRHLGAVIGVLAVLHTWGQNLHHHPHLHCVVTGGGLSCNVRGVIDEQPRWVSCRPGFFLPVRVLSRVFRGKFLAGLRAAFDQGGLAFAGRLASLTNPVAFAAWLTPLYQSDWVVYAKPPFGGPEQVLKYLARYTHRVAISNQRLLAVEGGQVTFRWKDYAQRNRPRTMTLSAEEFLRRFLQHVLPRSFVKIRHYGLLANRNREQKLTLARQLLLVMGAVLTVAATGSPAATASIRPATLPTCPACGGSRFLRLALAPHDEPAAGPLVSSDSS